VLLLYVNAWYLMLFVLTEIAVFIWKGELWSLLLDVSIECVIVYVLI